MRRLAKGDADRWQLLPVAGLLLLIFGCRIVAAQVQIEGEDAIEGVEGVEGSEGVEAGIDDLQSPVVGPLLIGLYINGSNGDDMEILQSGDSYWLPLNELADFAHFDVNPDSSITTPIGRVAIDADELLENGERLYISDRQLLQWLRIRSKFVSSDYSMQLELPWNGNGAKSQGSTPAAAPADVKPPKGSVSFVRLRNFSDRSSRADTATDWSTDTTLDAGGRIAGGTWLLGAREISGRGTFLNRYFWNKDTSNSATRLGTSFNNLNPLLTNIDYTGIQTAWSSTGIGRYRDFNSNLNFDSFLAEDLSFQREILREDGPPGGVAELRIDDRPVARVRIDLEGRYEFRDIQDSRGGYQKISVLLYQFSPLEPPLREIDLSRQLARELAQDGETLLRAGAGRQGNPFADDRYASRGDSTVGFALARHGLTERITLQGIAQRNEDETVTAIAGLRASLGNHWATALDIGDSEGSQSVFTELVGYGRSWDFRLQHRYEADGYRSTSPRQQSQRDTTLRTFFTVAPALRLGLVGRELQNPFSERIEFVKPAAFWDATDNLFLSALPILNGDYRLQAIYQREYHSRFTLLSFDNTYSLTHDYNPDPGINLQTGYEYREQNDRGLVFSQINWQMGNSVSNNLRAGLSWDGRKAGALLSWRRLWRPGVETELRWSHEYRSSSDLFDAGNRFLFTLRVDFAAVGRRLRPADNQLLNFTRGGISGRIVTANGQRLPVDDVNLQVNGRSLPQQQVAGEFYLGNLPPGVYSVALDEANLPIEYSSAQSEVRVQVAPASVTALDFLVSASFGLSGQALDAEGGALTARRVVALDANGNIAASAFTDRFGYYRLDALSPGTYRLQLVSAEGEALAEREATIVDDYLFEQDLQLR